MKIGKLQNDLLNSLVLTPVKKFGHKRKEVLVRPSIGEDCAVLDFNSDLIMLSSDPITATDKNAAKLLLTVCANDIAAAGGMPVGIMVTALIPPSATEQELKVIIDDLWLEAKNLNIEILGGHTEVTGAVNQIVLCGTIIGRVEKGRHIMTGGANIGDSVLMTKFAALEGTAIIAEQYEKILSNMLGNGVVQKAKAFANNLSVIEEARVAADFATGMHDVTEGGILGACFEASLASGIGFSIDIESIPIADETKAICRILGVNPYELISSGSLLITAKESKGLIEKLNEIGVLCTVIGKAVQGESTVTYKDGTVAPLKAVGSDAIYSVKPPKNVVFVCTGNTCRSPMAEGFAKSVNAVGFNFISRGISVCDSKVSENAVLAMKNQGIDISSHVPLPLTAEDIEDAFIILTMTSYHKSIIKHKSDDSGKVFSLAEFADESKNDVSDPFGLDLAEYIKCAEEIKGYVLSAVEKLGVL